MAFRRPWKSLSISGDCPLLLLKAAMDQTLCTLELTDLNRLWAISLTRNELVKSARQQGTSIDPGEDDEQFAQFLTKIQSALNREGKTRLQLEPGDAEHALKLSVSVPLPGSLPTFRWTMQLQRLDSDGSNALEADLVAPLLLYTNALQSQIQHLVDQLGHKDRVIAKIADKLENVGQDLTQVFPGASHIKFHKRAPKRAQLASHIDGLAPFDAALWQAESAKEGGDPEPSVEALDDLLTGLPASRLLAAHMGMKGSWWLSCGGGKDLDAASDGTEDETMFTDDRRESGSANETAGSPPILKNDGNNKLDGDFQRQATPPQRRHSNMRTSQPKAKAGLGAFGGKHKASAPEAERENSPALPSKRGGNDGLKLGTFGGQRKRQTPDPDVDGAASDSLQSPPKRTNKLGAFGGRSSRATNISPTKTKSHKVEAEDMEQKREHSEERANDRRDKLKRDIAERKKEPVKKKRKF
ncbi:hypothetical protein CERZMDRAFT_51495 [Cercospora zeae-maydis SCOH1-5]|uniref:Non-homologous end-joining factor 1 n=1 Tax=Cercospora zeae-maydis SCOH1-5 TaxID=717836 RepID=A0A6A6F0J5_9PEZI|nr:hypothetical protein CERZMDRAFT_51495 [Cercospora zeae-maydis SCOH1-5]